MCLWDYADEFESPRAFFFSVSPGRFKPAHFARLGCRYGIVKKQIYMYTVVTPNVTYLIQRLSVVVQRGNSASLLGTTGQLSAI